MATRKSVFVIFLLVIIAETRAQDYKISFAATGATTVLCSVKVENLTRGSSVVLNANDTLHLRSAMVTVSPDIAADPVQLYPNPVTDHSILSFCVLEKGNRLISIIDLLGRTIYQTRIMLPPGKHGFRLSGIDAGVYVVKVSAKKFTHSIKLVSESRLRNRVEMEPAYFQDVTVNNPLKSAETTIEMVYDRGDLLLFKGTAGTYSAIMTDVPANSKTITFNFAACRDRDGNNYTTALIGNQTWMAENLKTTHFSDGTAISQVQSNTEWGNLGYSDKAFCYYDNSLANGNTFGALYTWAAAMNGAGSSILNPSYVQGACPCGWHLPSDEEWVGLEMYLGMSNEEAYGLGWRGTNEGDKLKSASGWYNDGTGTNASGFSALPGGSRKNGLFDGLTKTTVFWSSTEYFNITYLAFNRSLSYLYSQVGWFSAAHYYGYPKNDGLSVRCLKD